MQSSFNSIQRQSEITKTFAILSVSALAAFGQPAVDLPRASPLATVSQSLGYTTVTVT